MPGYTPPMRRPTEEEIENLLALYSCTRVWQRNGNYNIIDRHGGWIESWKFDSNIEYYADYFRRHFGF